MKNSLAVVGPAGHDYTELAAVLRQFQGETLVFVPNPGNAGDALINLGMYELLKDLDVKWEIGSFTGTYHDRVILFSGGGALVSVYPDADIFFRRNHPVCKALILLPHTVRAYAELLKGMDERCHLFTREKLSFDHVRQCTEGGAKVYLSHDLAFYLSDKKIAGLPWDWNFLKDRTVGPAWLKMLIKIIGLDRMRTSELHVIRDDAESTDAVVPKGNYDLSTMFATGHLQAVGRHMTPGVCASTAKALRAIVRSFSVVKTNRLHVAIVSGLAGTETKMLDNSYGKNSSIFEHSIDRFYPNVRFRTSNK